MTESLRRQWPPIDRRAEDRAVRAALTRAHLAASELRREAMAPRAQRLVERILAATRDLDAVLGSARPVASPERHAPRGAPSSPALRASAALRSVDPVDPGAELLRLQSRLGPALLGRGIAWSAARLRETRLGQTGLDDGGVDPAPSAGVDASALRRAVCAGVELVTARSVAGSTLDVTLEGEGSCWQIELVLTTPASVRDREGAGRSAHAADGVRVGEQERVAESLAREGVELCVDEGGGRVEIRLPQLRRGEAGSGVGSGAPNASSLGDQEEAVPCRVS